MKYSRSQEMMITVKGTSLVKIAVSFVLFFLMIFSVSGVLTSLRPEFRITSSSVNNAATNVTGELLFQLMGWENHNFLKVAPNDQSSPKLSTAMFTLSTNVNLDDPRSLLGRELPGFSLFDSKILVAGEGTNYTNMPVESPPPLEVLKAEEATLQNTEDINKADGGGTSAPPLSTAGRKVVYMYFTHNRESYLPYLKGVTNPDLAYHSQINVTKIGDKLKEELQSKGIGAEVDKTDIMGNLVKKGWSMPQAYQESRPIVQTAMAGNRDLQYFIDIHRDSKRKENTTININGQSYAKLAFVIGAEQQNYDKNLAFATALHDRLKEKYKGLSRGIIQSKGALTNGKFNQDLSQNAILIEFGGVDNTFEELNRSAAALADVFSEYYWQAEKVNQQSSEPANEK